LTSSSDRKWADVELGDMITLHRGYDLPSGQRHEGSVPVVSSSGTTGYHDEPKVQPPGVVTGRYGTLGEVFFVEEPFWPLNTTLYVSDFHGNDERFISYFLQCQSLAARDGASAVPGINRNVLHRLPAKRPPLQTQRKIAAVLSVYDDLIENNNRRIKVLEEMAQRIYREWFVDFRFSGHEKNALLDSELGPVPEGWRVSPLSSVADIVRGRSYRKNDLVETGGLPFVNLKCLMRGGGFRLDGLKRYQGQYDSDQKVREGDIVLGVTDLTQQREILARATLVPRLDDDFGVISLDVVRIVPRSIDDRLALFFALGCTDFADRVKEFANGSTVLHLSPTHVAQNSLVWPPRELRRQFVGIVEPIVKMISALAEARKSLVLTRDLLLPRLISGEFDVANLNIAMPEAAA
jgi:type I restriction enzyme S subunit